MIIFLAIFPRPRCKGVLGGCYTISVWLLGGFDSKEPVSGNYSASFNVL